jgi:flagellin-like protein
MKGVSPMIATVLLIAFTIAVGGIISIWLTGYTRTTTEAVGGGTEKQIKCAASILKIKDVSNTSQNVTILVYYESGSESLSNITCEALGGGHSNSTNVNGTKSPGDSFYCPVIDFNTTNLGPLEVVRAKGMCLGEIPISVDCKPTQACW